jgi:phosphatidylinositol 4-kinase type 2
MFARQIAVMKGQAWNVVETLKISDHGPLELTRRTRVCVWDDLVDIPVAIPLRTPPADIRRPRELPNHRAPSHEIEEEMDISAANGPKPRDDLLRFSPPPAGELPNPNRFSLSREPGGSGMDLTQLYDAPGSPSTIGGEPFFANGSNAKNFVDGAGAAQAGLTRSKTGPSFEGTRHRASSSLSHGRF